MNNLYKPHNVLIIIMLLINGFALGSVGLTHVYNITDGLSNNRVPSITRDNHGFMWFGTSAGLNRFDGYNFEQVNFTPDVRQPVNCPRIESLFTDVYGNIWIGTKTGGLKCYDVKNEQFTYYPYTPGNQAGVSGTRAISFCQGADTSLWIGTWNGGISRYNYNTNTFKHYLCNTLAGPSGENVGGILCARDGSVWAVSYFGLWKYSEISNNFEKLPFIGIEPNNDNYVGFISIEEDPVENKFWIGSWEHGLVEFDKSTGVFTPHKPNAAQLKNSDGAFNVFTLLVDRQHQFWVGSWGNGLWKFNTQSGVFQKIDLQVFQNNEQQIIDVVLDIYQDPNSNIWIGTNNHGVVKLGKKQPFNNTLFNYKVNKPIALSVLKHTKGLFVSTLSHGIIYKNGDNEFEQVYPESGTHLFESNLVYLNQNGKIWADGDNYFYQIEFINNKPVLIPCHVIYNNNDFKIKKITGIAESGNKLYIGTKENSLYMFNYKNGNYTLVKHFEVKPGNYNYLQNETINNVFTDNTGKVWVGTNGGLHLITDTLVVYSNKLIEQGKRLTCDVIHSINQCQSNNILVSTPCGINILTPNNAGTYALKTYTTNDGLPDNFIMSIVVNKQNQVWMNSSNAIIGFNTQNQNFLSFFKTDGIGITEFDVCGYIDTNGTVYFGGKGGIVSFVPALISQKVYGANVVITNFKVHNTPIKPNKQFNNRVIINKSINCTNNIVFTHNEKEFSFELAYLNFVNPQKNHYAYKLEGYNNNWVNLGNQRLVSFNNLNPGDYKLFLKASGNNGQWVTMPNPINIKIKAPYYKTWYAYLFYYIIILTIFIIIRRYFVKQMRLQRNIEILQLTNQQEHRINEMKLQFFTNIAHEFRTPLTLIIGPLTDIIADSRFNQLVPDIKNKINLVAKNSHGLMKLVNQLLDFRKTENGKMELKAELLNIGDFVSEVALSFKNIADINQIKFTIVKDDTIHGIWFDREKIEVVVNNLISNAFKFVGYNGIINVEINQLPNFACIHVVDNGIGIPATDLDKIFDRFYQANRPNANGGSGIGLALARRFVELHNGKIEVFSQPGIKTEFIVYLPFGDTHLLDNQKIKNQNYCLPNQTATFNTALQNPMLNSVKAANPSITLLIIDDNAELRGYLNSIFAPYYNIIEAPDGKIGFDMAINHNPDIIISDIMMPNTDGYEFCQKLRNNLKTQTTPVILLTAKNSSQSELQGIKVGADAFVSKPFDPAVLKEKVRSLLMSRKKLKDTFSKKMVIEGSNIEISGYEEKLLKKAIKLIEDNMLNETFSAETLAQMLNLSRSSLYRKLKTLTGYSINHFIRKIKLDKAAQLLADNEKTVTDVAFLTGFSDIKYFRDCFEKQFGLTPQKYRNSLNTK